MNPRTRWLAASVSILVLGPMAALGPALAETADGSTSTAKTDETSRKVRAEAMTADAVATLKRAADFLAAQKTFLFGADIRYDVRQPTGQMLEFGGTRKVLMRRPDRLRIEAVGRNGIPVQTFFDGQSILMDLPAEDAYMRVEKPGTLYAAVDYLIEDLETPSPLQEFLSENFAAGVEPRIQSAFYVQNSKFGDRICEQLAFRTDVTDFQIWLEVGDEPLPCRLVITYKRAKGNPQFIAQFRDWDLAPESDDEMFQFTPPASAERLQVQAIARELREQRGQQGGK